MTPNCSPASPERSTASATLLVHSLTPPTSSTTPLLAKNAGRASGRMAPPLVRVRNRAETGMPTYRHGIKSRDDLNPGWHSRLSTCRRYEICPSAVLLAECGTIRHLVNARVTEHVHCLYGRSVLYLERAILVRRSSLPHLPRVPGPPGSGGARGAHRTLAGRLT